MVAKKCPDCDQTLPVACKSCPCGHIFISKKQLTLPLQDKTESVDGHRDQRLRPEVPKLANKDFDYNYGKMDIKDINDDKEALNTRLLISQPSTSQTLHLVVRSYPQTSKTTSEMTLNTLPTQEASHILGEGYIISKRKRGRPKGSKNKPKPIVPPGEEPPSHEDTQTQNNESGDPTKRKRGRPKGSKNKPKDPLLHLNKDDYSSDPQDDYYQEPFLDTMPHISKEKAISYSIVLSDINQKMLKQSSMNFV